MIYDVTGSFHIVYYFNAATYAVTALIYALIVLINRRKPAWLFPPTSSADSATLPPGSTNYGTAAPASSAPGAVGGDDVILYDRLPVSAWANEACREEELSREGKNENEIEGVK